MEDDKSTSSDESLLDDDDNDVSLEDIEVSEDELKQAETTDESDLETESDDDEEAESDEQTEASDDDESDEETEPELTKEQEAAKFKAEMFERRQAEKTARDATIQQSQEAYLDEAQSAEDLALRQLQIDAYETKVERTTNKLTNQYETALKDFPILRSDDPIVQRELDEAIDNFQARYVQVDEFGNAVNSSADMYAYLQNKAQAIEQLTGIGARQQEQAKTRQKAKAVTTPQRSPREPKVDPELAEFWKEANS